MYVSVCFATCAHPLLLFLSAAGLSHPCPLYLTEVSIIWYLPLVLHDLHDFSSAAGVIETGFVSSQEGPAVCVPVCQECRAGLCLHLSLQMHTPAGVHATAGVIVVSSLYCRRGCTAGEAVYLWGCACTAGGVYCMTMLVLPCRQGCTVQPSMYCRTGAAVWRVALCIVLMG